MKTNSAANHGWWPRIKLGRVTATLTVLLCLSALSVIARPRPLTPFLPEHENYRQRFELFPTNRASNLFIPELTTHNLYLRNVTRLDSWAGYSVALGGDQAPASYCYIPALSGPKRNFNPLEGSFRWYYAPGWSSGEGPGHRAVLIEVTDVAGTPACGWTLSVNPQGTRLQIHAFAGDDPELLLSAPIQWEAGAFHQLGVVVSASNNVFRLMVDGQIYDQSTGPGPMDQLVPMERWGLFVGSTSKGRHPAEGCFNELVAWSGQCTEAHYAWDFAQQSPRMNLGPITPEEDQSRRQRILARRAGLTMNTLYTMDDSGPPSPPSFGGGGGTSGGGPTFGPGPTNGLMLTIPIFGSNLLSTTISNGMTNVLYDLFMTTNLVYHPTNSQWTWVTNGYITDLFTLSNPPSPVVFFILGTTNDSDVGGFTDAFELLVSHTATNNPADDQLVGLELVDGVAMEPPATNTATFRIFRLGNYPVSTNEALTVELLASGTAVYATDYTLSSITTNGTNLTVTIPANQASVDVILTPLQDTTVEGAETATLQFIANYGRWRATNQATALILDYSDYAQVYSSNADFNLGLMSGLEAVSNQVQFKTNLPPMFPFINVACSDRGTVARINTTNGQVIGEYLTAPVPNPSPSRTTVDQYGNVWVANREDNLSFTSGSITRIGLILGGTRYDKSGTNYVANPKGQYVMIADAAYNTCLDRDGDGYIRTSTGLANVLPWSNANEVDTYGGVTTAEDEAITEYTRVACIGTRTIAVDRFNDIWVGGRDTPQTHQKINGLTGQPVPDSAFDPYAGGYGGVIDGLGNLWSASLWGGAMWLRPSTNYPPTTNDWTYLYADGTAPYGIALDPVFPYVWQTSGNSVFRWQTNGTVSTTPDTLFYHGNADSQGLTVDTNGQVWVAHSYLPLSRTVGHLNTNATWLGNIDLTLPGLLAEYYQNTNAMGEIATSRLEGTVNYNGTNWLPQGIVSTNFSVRWSGYSANLTNDVEYTFYVSANAGAGYRLKITDLDNNSWVYLDNWTSPDPGVLELSGDITWNSNFRITLEYQNTGGNPEIRLQWKETATASPQTAFATNDFAQVGLGPTGVSVAADGNIWVSSFYSDNVMRIDPNAGPQVVRDGLTNRLGAVDRVVHLGDGNGHTLDYQNPAHPYNYSDMTGLNNRVVNPSLQPFKGYWTVIHDSQVNGLKWNLISWNAALTNGCEINVFVRANDDRGALSGAFLPVTNNVAFTNVAGRYIEFRLSLSREATNQYPMINNLTLFGSNP